MTFDISGNPLFNWSIVQLDASPSLDSLSDVVRTVHWRYSINFSDVSGVEYNTDIYGSLDDLGSPDANSFIPYNELTKTTVVAWLESKYDMTVLQSQLMQKLNDLYHPSIVPLSLPFQN
jgi:hypothetical protein